MTKNEGMTMTKEEKINIYQVLIKTATEEIKEFLEEKEIKKNLICGRIAGINNHVQNLVSLLKEN